MRQQTQGRSSLAHLGGAALAHSPQVPSLLSSDARGRRGGRERRTFSCLGRSGYASLQVRTRCEHQASDRLQRSKEPLFMACPRAPRQEGPADRDETGHGQVPWPRPYCHGQPWPRTRGPGPTGTALKGPDWIRAVPESTKFGENEIKGANSAPKG